MSTEYTPAQIDTHESQSADKLDILYHDQELIVCVKPVGLDSEVQLPALIKEIIHKDCYPVHRLDLNVGGVMVYALTKQAASALSKAIQEKTMIKDYVALVHGITPEAGDYEDYLFKDSRKNKVFVVKKQRKGVKRARLEFKRIKTEQNTSLIHIRLYTGRSHQIRVQFSSRGYPLVGDHKYGARDKLACPMLFSRRISFTYKGKNHCYEALPKWAK